MKQIAAYAWHVGGEYTADHLDPEHEVVTEMERFEIREGAEGDGLVLGVLMIPTEIWRQMGEPNRVSFACVPAPIVEKGIARAEAPALSRRDFG